MSSFPLLGLITFIVIVCTSKANPVEQKPQQYLLNYFSQANDYQQNYYRQCINIELLVRHIPVEERTFKYFYQLARQIYASRRYLHDLLVAGEVTILTVGKNHFRESALDPVTAKQVQATEIIATLIALFANFFNIQKNEAPMYEFTNCIDCLTAEEKYRHEPETCKYSMFYEADGSCLNPKLPGAGAANREYRRLAQPFCTLRNERNTCQLPNARKVSLAVQEAVNNPHDVSNFPEELPDRFIPNLLVTNIAQLNAHDHVYGRFQSNERGHLGHSACTVDQRKPLSDLVVATASVPITVDCTDPFYGQFNVSCLNFVKQQKLNEDCQLRIPGTLNQATIVEDLDMVYVDHEERVFVNSENGDIKYDDHGLPVIPDHRSKQHLGLFVAAYFLARLHNLFAAEVRKKCPKLSGFEVFQTARAVNTGSYQNLMYDQILGAFIGDDKVAESQLSSYYDTFDEYQEPEILSEYACAAGRAFHKFTPDELLLLNEKFKLESAIPFKHTFYFDETNVELLNQVGFSAMNQPWKTNGYSDQITNHLFFDHHLCYGTDMLSIDIQRNRDCALKPYIHYLSLFFGVCVRDWDDLRGHISDKNLDILRSRYTRVEDVDLRAGGDLEEPYGHSVFGKTFTRLMVEQHSRLKNDPKWWTRIFNAEQQEQIRSVKLSDLVCIVFGYDKTLEDARWAWSKNNKIVKCRTKSLSDIFDASKFCNLQNSYYA